MTESTTVPARPSAARSELVGSLAVLFAAACWGASGVFVKTFGEQTGISALAFAFRRDLVTFLILLIGLLIFRRRWLRVARRDIVWLVALGASLGTFHVFWNLGVFLNGAAVATIQQAAMPAIVAVAGWVIWREPLNWSKIAAIALTFLGTALVSGVDVLGQSELTPAGLIVGLGIPTFYATWTLLGKRARQDHNPLTVLTYGFAFAALTLLPLQFFTPQVWPIPASAWAWFAALIFISTIAGFTVYTYALGYLPASVAGILVMSEIVFATTFAYLFLGERLTPSQILGALLVVVGVVLLSWNRQRNLRQGADVPVAPG